MKVLYATDGLKSAANAGALLTRLADPSKVQVTVLAVAPGDGPMSERAELMLQTLDQKRKHAQAVVETAAGALALKGYETRSQTAEGDPGYEMVQLASREGSDLVVVGASRHSWLGNALLGSTSTYVLHSAPCSVLIVHEGPSTDGPLKVLLTTDGSRGAYEAAKAFAAVAAPPMVDVEAFAVMPVVPVAVPFMPLPYGEDGLSEHFRHEDEIEIRMRSRAERDLRKVEALLTADGFTCEKQIGMGNPTEHILKEAESSGCDLVVLGSRGRGPIRRALLGSVSDQVARHARAALVTRSVS